MFIKQHISVLDILRWNWQMMFFALFTVSAMTVLYLELLRPYIEVSVAVMSSLGTAISFFVGFITAQAYDRWWEARKIWGTLVNDSRSFSRMVVTMLPPGDDAPDVTPIRERLVRRHIAFLYAVKERLRGESTAEYLGYLNETDVARIRGVGHPGNILLELQGADIDAAERSGRLDVIRMAQFNDMLSRFSTSMGMAERIKTTVFPPHYAAMVRLSIWIFMVVFPVALSEVIGYWAIVYSFLLGTIFLLVFRVGQSLLDPFDGKPGDTPMSSIVRTIEINLLEQIGQKDLPSPVEPIAGRYLP